MKISRTVATLVAAALTTSAAAAADRAPDFMLKDLDGANFRLSEALTKGPILIDFWATWCAPCIEELPQLNRIHQTYGPAGLQVIAISIDNSRSRSQVDPFVSSNEFEFRVLLDPDMDVRRRFGGTVTPYTALIAADGSLVFDHSGYVPGDEKALEAAVRQLLKLPEAPPADDAGGGAAETE